MSAFSVAITAVALAGILAGAPAHAKASKNRPKPKPATVQPATEPPAQPPALTLPGDAEGRLLQAIRQVQQQNLDGALKTAEELTQQLPHFRAAQLVYADLLRFKTGQAGALTAQAQAPNASAAPEAGLPAQAQAHLNGLHDELLRRVHAASALPPPGSIPAEFLLLDASVGHAIAVDASKSRLYLFAHENGQLRLIENFYVSVGRLGTGKTQEGDPRTPQGLYFIGRQISGMKLPQFYGKGALTTNYPNDWDRAQGRSGGGIWLHGTPPDDYARLPEASDGCVVLSIPDMAFLMQTVSRHTPVLIRDRLQWTPPQELTQSQSGEAFIKAFDDWKTAWQSADQHRLADLYDAGFMASKPASQERLAAYFSGAGAASVQALSVYAWKDAQGEIRIVSLKAHSKAFTDDLQLRQYWRRKGNRWELFSEDVLG
jgi:lipoprotein-anchoring transpeptidase ErfK/SrfK